MKKQNAIRRLLSLLLFAALGFGLGLPQALSALSPADYEGTLNIEPYKAQLTRPISAFDHEAHMELVSDCADCHHGKTEDGKQDKEDYDPSESCDSCHTPAGGKGVTPLKRAYHQNCISCHKDVNKGPTHCAGCHKA